jgi:signal transduction histidine kinase
MIANRCPGEGSAAFELALLRHELSQPLTYLTASITLLIDQVEDGSAGVKDQPSVIRDALATIEETVLHVNSIVRRIGMECSNDQLEPVDLSSVVHGTLSIVESEMAGTAELVVRIECAPIVRANPGRLRQAFLNVLTNALFAVRESAKPKGTIVVSLVPDGVDRVLLTVQDDGIGIPEDVRDRLGALDFTTRPGIGTGVGLALSRYIVESYGGSLALEPVSSGGALAKIVLPVAPT